MGIIGAVVCIAAILACFALLAELVWLAFTEEPDWFRHSQFDDDPETWWWEDDEDAADWRPLP